MPLIQRLGAAIFSAAETVDRKSAARSLLSAFDLLSEVSAGIGKAERLRPLIGYWRKADDIIDALWHVFETYLNAFVAPDPWEAQHLGEEGQEAMDKLTSRAVRLGQWVDTWEAAFGEDPDPHHLPVTSLIEVALREAGVTNALELEEVGQDFLSTRYHLDSVSSGLGLTVAMLEKVGTMAFDFSRVERLIDDVLALINKRSTQAAALFSDQEWAQAFSNVSAALVHLSVETDLMGKAGLQSREWEARTLLRLGFGTIEEAAVPLLQTILTLSARKSYARVRRYEIGQLLSEMHGQGYEEMLEGISTSIRDAIGHSAYRVHGDIVEFSSTRADYKKLSLEQLQDRVLAALESCLAMQTGLLIAMLRLGIDIDAVLPSEFFFEWEQGLRMSFAMTGAHTESIELSGNRVIVKLRDMTFDNPFLIGLLLAHYLPPEVESAELAMHMPNECDLVATVPMRWWRAWSGSEDPTERLLLGTAGIHSWSLNGVPCSSDSDFRCKMALLMLSTIDRPFKDAVACLRRAREIAGSDGDLELATAITANLKWRREQILAGQQCSVVGIRGRWPDDLRPTAAWAGLLEEPPE